MRSSRKRILEVCAAVAIVVTVAQEVLAVVGRPATPASVAGVARRTARRN
jgi:hypothetical protein